MYIAETLLPTRQGKYRLRGYKHSVRATGAAAAARQREHAAGRQLRGRAEVLLRLAARA